MNITTLLTDSLPIVSYHQLSMVIPDHDELWYPGLKLKSALLKAKEKLFGQWQGGPCLTLVSSKKTSLTFIGKHWY